MATTIFTINSNRLGADVYVRGSSAAVAIDAAVAEQFILPAGFGDLLFRACEVTLSSFSAAYVAPSPAFDGAQVDVVSSDGSTQVDVVGAARFTLGSTVSGRPHLVCVFDLNSAILLRQGERFSVQMPILAGAGATATVSCSARGLRIKTS